MGWTQDHFQYVRTLCDRTRFKTAAEKVWLGRDCREEHIAGGDLGDLLWIYQNRLDRHLSGMVWIQLVLL